MMLSCPSAHKLRKCAIVNGLVYCWLINLIVNQSHWGQKLQEVLFLLISRSSITFSSHVMSLYMSQYTLSLRNLICKVRFNIWIADLVVDIHESIGRFTFSKKVTVTADLLFDSSCGNVLSRSFFSWISGSLTHNLGIEFRSMIAHSFKGGCCEIAVEILSHPILIVISINARNNCTRRALKCKMRSAFQALSISHRSRLFLQSRPTSL